MPACTCRAEDVHRLGIASRARASARDPMLTPRQRPSPLSCRHGGEKIVDRPVCEPPRPGQGGNQVTSARLGAETARHRQLGLRRAAQSRHACRSGGAWPTAATALRQRAGLRRRYARKIARQAVAAPQGAGIVAFRSRQLFTSRSAADQRWQSSVRYSVLRRLRAGLQSRQLGVIRRRIRALAHQRSLFAPLCRNDPRPSSLRVDRIHTRHGPAKSTTRPSGADAPQLDPWPRHSSSRAPLAQANRGVGYRPGRDLLPGLIEATGMLLIAQSTPR